jgi:hypothetical protein
MPNLIDLTGKKFERLTVIGLDPERGNYGEVFWFCRCDCGTRKRVSSNLLRRGEILSCGCLIQEKKTKHGMARTETYRSWRGMRRRCGDENNNEFHQYGGRGIKVCDRWQEFSAFFEDMGERPEGTTLDRIDPNGDYEPSNCRWATHKQQRLNCRNTVFVEYEGKRQPLADLCEKLGAPYQKAWRRMKRGYSVEDACSTGDMRKRSKSKQ